MSNPPLIKTAAEIQLMKASGRVLSAVLEEVKSLVKPGVTTGDLNEAARVAMDRLKAKPSFLDYAPWGKTPYPAVICISVEDQVVHGIPGRCRGPSGTPTADRVLCAGEIVSLDCGVQVGGFHSDMAVTVAVGAVSAEKQALMNTCREALWAGIRAVRPGVRLRKVVKAISSASGRYGIVEGFGGHGIGRNLHEAPFIPNSLDSKFEDLRLHEGLVLALEPMLNLGCARVYEAEDNWTVKTKDGLASAHFEHTVAVTKNGFEVLTLSDGEGQ